MTNNVQVANVRTVLTLKKRFNKDTVTYDLVPKLNK